MHQHGGTIINASPGSNVVVVASHNEGNAAIFINFVFLNTENKEKCRIVRLMTFNE